MNDMHGWVKTFSVDPDEKHVIMTCHNPDEGQDVTVRVSRFELETMLNARPMTGPAPLPQTLRESGQPCPDCGGVGSPHIAACDPD